MFLPSDREAKPNDLTSEKIALGVGSTSEGPMNFSKINQQAAQMDDLVECIWENKQSRVSGDEGLADLLIIEAIVKSCDTGKAVDLI